MWCVLIVLLVIWAVLRMLIDDFAVVLAIMVVLAVPAVLIAGSKERKKAETGKRNKAPDQPGDGHATAPGAEVSLSDAELAQIHELLTFGEKVKAIKLVRAKTGMDLRQAKNYVDALEREKHS